MILEELIELKVGSVYAASRYGQDVAQAPSRVSILTGEKIKLYGHRLNDNLFDQHCGHRAGSEHLQDVILQDGRTFRAKLTCRF